MNQNYNLANSACQFLFCYVYALVTTCFGGRFGINCPSAFLNILKMPRQNEGISKFSKITRVIYLKNRPYQTCGYWLTTRNEQTLCMETNIF